MFNSLRVRDFYKPSNYEKKWHYLYGMIMCTFVLLPLAVFFRIVHKVVK